MDWYWAGGEQITLTAAADGDASIVTVGRPTVRAGVEYVGYVYLNPPAAGAGCWVEVRWYDAGGAQIAAERATLAAPGTGLYRQQVSGVAPAGAVTCAVAVGISDATAGQVVRFEGVIVTPRPADRLPGSVLPLADSGFEQGVGSWTVSSGAATIARSGWVTTAGEGNYTLEVSSAAGTSVLTSGRYPVTGASLPWEVATGVRVDAGGWQVGPAVAWYDAGGAQIAVTSDGSTAMPADGQWWTVSADVVAPAGAVSAEVQVTVTATDASSVVSLDAVTLVQELPQAEADPDDVLGRVVVVLRDLTVGDLLTLWRIVGARQTLVRGAAGLITGLPLTATQYSVEDYEAPIGQPVSYRMETHSAAGGLTGFATFGPVTLSVPGSSMCWVKDPVEPYRNVLLRASVPPDWSRPAQATEYRIRGRRNSVMLYDVRGGLTGTLQVWTLTDAERQALHFATDTGNPLLIQFSPGLGIEDAYVSVGDTTEARVIGYAGEPRRLWSLPLTQVDQPIGGVVGTAGWTVRDVATTYATALDVTHAYATVLDLALDTRRS